tara:strand:+ start:9381 stop:9734 length:354 start_codon:yes stop_codon:yes gene_type:complete
MKTQSAKAKGRKLQKWVVDKLVEILKLDPEDIESRPMGSQGEDVIMGKQSREKFPFSIECKNQEALNIWKAYEQAEENCKGYEPIVVIKRNKTKPLLVIDAEKFIKFIGILVEEEEQ